MADKIGDAILELKTDVSKLVKGMNAAKKTADTSMNKMQARADKFAKFMKGALGLGGVVLIFNKLKNVVGDLIAVYGIQETAETKLTAAIKASGKEASISADALFDYASELQGVTTYGDEATISALAMLQQLADLNEEGLKETIPLIQDFAAAMKVDLDTAASLVGKTLGSSTNALSRYGLEVDMTGTKQEKLASLTDAMREKFGGMAKELAQTGTGALIQFNNALGDIKEEGGKAILDIMAPMLENLTSHLSLTLQNWKATANLNKALKGEATSIYEVDKALSENNERLDEAQNSTLVLSEKLKEAQAAFDLEREKVENGTAAYQTQIGVRADTLAAIRAQVDANAKEIEQRVENEKLLKKNREEIEKSNVVKSADVIITRAQTEAIEGEVEAQEALTIALEDHMSAAEALSIAAAEAYLIEQEAAEAAADAADELLKKKKEDVAFITGPFVSAYSEAFGEFGKILVEGGNAWNAFREAFKETIAGLLDAIGQKLIIMALEALIPLPGLFNPAGAGMAFAGAAAAFTSAGVVRALATGGDFETRGPQLIMVGDNPGGREQVSVTPTSSPNINGPGSGMIQGDVYFDGTKMGRWIGKMSENGEMTIHPRSIRK